MLVVLRQASMPATTTTSGNLVRLATESSPSESTLKAMFHRAGFRCVSFANLEDAIMVRKESKESPIQAVRRASIVFPSHSPTHAVAALLSTSSSSPSGSPQQQFRQQKKETIDSPPNMNLASQYLCVMLDGLRSAEHIQFVDELRQAQPQLLIFGSTNGSKLAETEWKRYAKVGMDAIFESGCRLQDEFANVLEEARFFGPGQQCIYISADGSKTRVEKNSTLQQTSTTHTTPHGVSSPDPVRS